MTILVQQLRAEIEQLKAENAGLKAAKHTVECRFEVSEDTLSCIRGCLRAAEGDIDQLKAENAELKSQAGKALGPLTLGLCGKAFDPPGTHRAYTYAEQPDDQGAWRLGEALVEAHAMPAGDHIDGGLGLLKALQLRSFGVFEMDKAMTKEEP